MIPKDFQRSIQQACRSSRIESVVSLSFVGMTDRYISTATRWVAPRVVSLNIGDASQITPWMRVSNERPPARSPSLPSTSTPLLSWQREGGMASELAVLLDSREVGRVRNDARSALSSMTKTGVTPEGIYRLSLSTARAEEHGPSIIRDFLWGSRPTTSGPERWTKMPGVRAQRASPYPPSRTTQVHPVSHA